MKLRDGFISNSSTTSYLILTREPLTYELLRQFFHLDKNLFYNTVFKSVCEQIMDILLRHVITIDIDAPQEEKEQDFLNIPYHHDILRDQILIDYHNDTYLNILQTWKIWNGFLTEINLPSYESDTYIYDLISREDLLHSLANANPDDLMVK